MPISGALQGQLRRGFGGYSVIEVVVRDLQLVWFSIQRGGCLGLRTVDSRLLQGTLPVARLLLEGDIGGGGFRYGESPP